MIVAWRPSRNTALITAAGVIALLVGVLFGRADLALFGVPLVLVATLAERSRPEGNTEFSFSGLENNATGVVSETLTVAPAPGTEAVQVRVHGPGHRPAIVVVSGEAPQEIAARFDSLRTGPSPSFTVVARGYSTLAGYVEDPLLLTAPNRLVLPAAAPLLRVPTSRRLRGLTGPRRSPRLGDGAELRDIHQMMPGDRARRVDWRATARMSPELDQLFVRRTYASAEAGAVLVVDSRDDVGPDLTTWRGSEPLRVDQATSLDIARHAAAAIAAALTEAGDRVGLEDLARRRRPLAPAMGRRHLRRILQALALAAPIGEPSANIRPPQLASDVIVYLFTTLLDDAPLELVRSWCTLGMPVVVIDTLPGIYPVENLHLRLAWRITTMERADRLAELAALGVPAIRWAALDGEQAAERLETLVRVEQSHRHPSGGPR
ncbi:MAG: DUF58 domain-containing protein [Promicromonosporaceae bacterium]|nr:DUF58 domain-containing protein [Promicromonosporaceae bacterium]